MSESFLSPWTVLAETPLVTTCWIDARVERCRTPSGAVVDDYTVLHYPDWACAAALTKDGRFVMTRQWRQGAQAVSLECAGGVVDPGEAPEAAAARELLEETGYAGTTVGPLLTLRPNPASQRNWFWPVLITGCEKIADPMEHATEKLETLIMSAREVTAAIADGEMNHALHVAIVLWVIASRPDMVGSGT